MSSPPEIARPFANATERAEARADFLRLGSRVEQVIVAANGGTVPSWLKAELGKPLRGLREPPEQRLSRYHVVFAEELQALTDALEYERQHPLDDSSLRAAHYLAQRLLASLLDCPINELSARVPLA